MLNPLVDELPNSALDLVIAGTADGVLMVESQANELSEDVMLGAVRFGHSESRKVIDAIIELAEVSAKDAWGGPEGEDTSALEKISARVEVHRGDLRDQHAVAAFCQDAQGADLFHLAGLIHPALFTRDFDAVNVGGGENVLRAATQNGVCRAVIMSSNSPMGTNPDRTHRFDESSPYRPYMGYGRSKQKKQADASAIN